MKIITLAVLLCLLSFAYGEKQEPEAPRLANVQKLSNKRSPVTRPKNNSPARRTTKERPKKSDLYVNKPLPIPRTITATLLLKPPGQVITTTCPRRKFKKRQICKNGHCKKLVCPELFCSEGKFFKTEAEIRHLARQAGAGVTSSRKSVNASRTKRGAHSLGCGNYVIYETSAVDITDYFSGNIYLLHHIPTECGGPLHQLVFYNDCSANSCCGGNGTCNPKPVPLQYIDNNLNVITVYQVLFCECENIWTSEAGRL